MRKRWTRSRKKFSSTWLSKLLFLLPGVLGVTIFILIPFLDVLRRSLYTSLSGEFCGLDNYRRVLQNQAFKLAVYNTVRFMGVCLSLLLAGGLALAVVMERYPFLEKWKTLYLLPMAMPAASIVLVWKLIFAKQGFLNGILGTHIDFFQGENVFRVLVFTYVWRNLGYTLVLWLAALKAVPGEILEAARVDGAGNVRSFFYITLPCLKGSCYTITVLSLLNAFKVFREAYLISGAYPGEEIYLLQYVFNNWYTNLDFDKMAAGAVLSAAVIGSIAMALKRSWDRAEEDGKRT